MLASLNCSHSSPPTCLPQVESVVQYRMVYGLEQWLVKWKGYGEDGNTWEPWENLLTAQVQQEARKVKDASLPTSMQGLNKLTLPRLRSALQDRGLETTGLKAVVVGRLFAALQQS